MASYAQLNTRRKKKITALEAILDNLEYQIYYTNKKLKKKQQQVIDTRHVTLITNNCLPIYNGISETCEQLHLFT